MRKSFLLFFFCLIIYIPLISMIFHFGNIMPINENRNRVQLSLDLKLTDFNKSYRQIEKWFNDNFGFRDFLIRIQHQFDYSFFRQNDTLYFDNFGYLYYKNVIDYEQILNESKNLNDIIASLDKLNDFFVKRGIVLKTIIPPQKNEVVGKKNMLKTHVNRPKMNAYLRLDNSLINKKYYVPIFDELIKYNEDYPVYYKTDFHWNEFGGVVCFMKVINQFAYETNIDYRFSIDSLDIKELNNFKGGQLSNLSTLARVNEKTISVVSKNEITAKRINDESNNYIHWKNSKEGVFDGAVLIIGDSYSEYVLLNYNSNDSGITSLFDETYFCHWDKSRGILNEIPPNIRLVILERIESAISSFDVLINNLMRKSYE